MIKKFQTEIKWGIILTVVSIIWAYFEKLWGWHDEEVSMHLFYGMLFAIPCFVIYFFALREKRDGDFDGVMNWKQLVVSGAIMGAVVAAFSPLSQYLIYTYISPDYFKNAIESGMERGMTKEGAEAYFNLVSYIQQSALSAIPFGLVTAAILGMFLKRKA